MSLPPGATFGPYEVISPLGAGGMGEVYRARDTKLHREVALKTIPDGFANDPDRRARFEREARTLAALNHPHIAQVYAVEDRAIVMELVDGEDLSARLQRGPIPLDEALPIARQIAEALEAAHDAGIVHRDLKPGNIKVRPDGTVKVLDFGLAKAAATGTAASGSSDHSPTITTPAMTMQGVVLGTAAYMAPEQAKGRLVDRRADIWAFGCVLYEMLTGARTFTGEDVSDTLVSILRDDPRWTALPAGTPASVRQLLKRCLHKDPRKRLPHIGTARLELSDDAIGERVEPAARSSWTRTAAIALSGALAGAALAGVAVWQRFATASETATGFVRFSITPDNGTSFPGAAGVPRFAVSPDGRRIAYQVYVGNSVRLLLRALDSSVAAPIAGMPTDAAGLSSQQPFWSPDSRHLAFFDEPSRQLKRINLDSGLIETIAPISGNQFGGSWEGDLILFSSVATAGVQRVNASGGTPVSVTQIDKSKNERGHLWPAFLGDGRHFVYLSVFIDDTPPAIYVGSLDGGTPVRLFDSKTMAAVGWPDRLYFGRNDALLSQRIDLGSLTMVGEPELIAKAIPMTPSARIPISASRTGVIAFAEGNTGDDLGLFETHWVDRAGLAIPSAPPSVGTSAFGVRLSPDGQRLIYTRRASASNTAEAVDLWMQDLSRGIETRVTTRPATGTGLSPVFSSDGTRVLFRNFGEQGYELYDQPVSGATPGRLVLRGDPGENVLPLEWTSGNLLLLVRRQGSAFGAYLQPLAGGPPTTYLNGVAIRSAVLSPDERWLTYAVGDAAPQSQVFVQSFPDATRVKLPVSGVGAITPRWRGDGREIFFVGADQRLMSVSFSAAPRVEIGPPKPLFKIDLSAQGSLYDVSPDGSRFVVARPRLNPNGADKQSLTVVVPLGAAR